MVTVVVAMLVVVAVLMVAAEHERRTGRGDEQRHDLARSAGKRRR
jgi:hypothetical protein